MEGMVGTNIDAIAEQEKMMLFSLQIKNADLFMVNTQSITG
jgi:hypothetical protein